MFLFARVFGLFYYYFAVFRKGVFYGKVPFYWYLACLSGIKLRIVNIWLQCNTFVFFCADNTLLLKLLFVPCVWNLLQIKYIFLRNSYFLKIKCFSFSCLLYYYLKGSMLLCFLLLYWVFIKSVFVVCLEVVAFCDILIFKNIAFCRNCLLCLFWACFWLRDCVGCLLWFFCDWFYVWLMRWFVVFVLKVCFLDCSFWLFDLIDCSDWLFFIERLWFCVKEEK